MIPAQYYNFIYLIIVTILTIIYAQVRRDPNEKENNLSAFILCIFMVLFIGLRPISISFVDMVAYAAKYQRLKWTGFNIETDNILFDNLMAFLAQTRFDIAIFFILMSTIYFGAMLVTCLKLFPNHVCLSFLVCLAAFSTFSYATNGIKAGAAASLFLIAVAYYEKRIIAILFLFLSLGFHHSMSLPIGAFILAYFYKNTKVYFLGWFFCLVIALLHISFFQNLLAGFSDERGAEYLLSSGQNWGGKSGFRFDFVLYSAMPVLIGYWIIFRKQIISVTYEFILSIYLITNGAWMLCMYANFTNRIAYLSWFLYPIALIYPFLKEDLGENGYRMFATVAILHLSFTLFMNIIYY